MNENVSAEVIREVGKSRFFNCNGDAQKRSEGLRALIKAQSLGDPEATYIVTRLILDGALSSSASDQQ